MRDGDLIQITHDQSLVDHLLKEDLITPEVILTEHQLKDQDLLLLCSDGLYGMVGHNAIEKILLTYPVAQAVHELVNQANALGGQDNITVLVTRFTS